MLMSPKGRKIADTNLIAHNNRMNQKNKKFSTKATITLIAGFTAIAGIATLTLFHNDPAIASNTDIPQQAQPAFSFTSTPDWRQGPTNETSMALFSKARTDGTSACFTSAELKSGDVDVNAEMDELQKNLSYTGGRATLSISTPSVLRTSQGDKPYELRKYKIDGGNGSKNAMKGLAVGYVQLKDSYIKLSGHCETSDDLSSIAPALQSYKAEL